MPKVSDVHYEKKKQQILEAAKRVCITKPIYNVTMREIVIEARMSQGGVYKYFSNIDEVFVALLNQNTLTHEMESEVDLLFDENKEPIEILEDFFQYVGFYIQKSVLGSGKINFGLVALYSNDPGRFLKIKDQILQVSILEYLQRKFVTFITTQVEAQYFQPVITVEDIFAFATTAINGITHDALLAYNLPNNQSLIHSLNIEHLIKSLSFAVCKMLGMS